jgi:hypothetical protein
MCFLSSCEKNEEETTQEALIDVRLEYDLSWHENYDLYDNSNTVTLDWMNEWPVFVEEASEQLGPEIPEEVKVYVHEDGKLISKSTISGAGGTINASVTNVNNSSIFICNESADGFLFENQDDLDNTMVTTAQVNEQATSTKGFVDDEEETDLREEPAVLFRSYVDDVQTYTPNDEQTTIKVTMVPIVYTYIIAFGLEDGTANVASAKGAISGLARAAYVKSGETTSDKATFYFDCEVTENGINGKVNSFGIPEYVPDSGVLDEHDHIITNGREYGINLTLTMKDGSVKVYDFDVTDQVTVQPNGGMITITNIK